MKLISCIERGISGSHPLTNSALSCIYKILLGAGAGFKLERPFRIVGRDNIKIGENFYSEVGLKLEAWKTYRENSYTPHILIGDNVHLGWGCHITSINRVALGNNVLMGSNVFISDHSHGRTDLTVNGIPPIERELFSKGETVIESNVWIGNNVVIMPGVHVGEGAIIGANAVVTHNVPSCAVVGGAPSKIIRQM